MIFHDEEVAALDLSKPSDAQKLIEVHLCGHPKPQTLDPSDAELLREFVAKAASIGITFQQLNELLLVLNQDRISPAFFDFFFGDGIARAPDQPVEKPPLSMNDLKQAVIKFKGFAMVCFGNFRFAFRRLSTINELGELREELGPCCKQCAAIEAKYSARADKVLDVTPITRKDTWFVGEVTGREVRREIEDFEKHRRENPQVETKSEFASFGKQLAEMDERFNAVQKVALRNTDVYLTWDHLDVYVATSMRNQWEYEEVFDFTQDLFSRPILNDLKLRFFDPTQSKCRTRLDKGLVEGLMLRRANCTIYMAQDTDTFGKDSELASTLAQGKPVIVYVPSHETADYAAVVHQRPLKLCKIAAIGSPRLQHHGGG